MIEFYKIQGSGNDFILIDNRENALRDVGKIDDFVKTVCRQHTAVGADGLIVNYQNTRVKIYSGRRLFTGNNYHASNPVVATGSGRE